MDVSRFYFIIEHVFNFHALLFHIMYTNKTLFIKWMNQSLVTIHDVSQIMVILACHAKSETSVAHDDVPL